MTYQPGDQLLDKYRIEARIGQGAFGDVYRVLHTSLKVTRALKVLRRDAPGIGSTQYTNAQERFQLEAQLGARLNSPNANPNLLQVYDFHSSEDLIVLEMEYASGGSLAERLQKYKEQGQVFPIPEALQIAQDVAGGLAALHAKDIVHRDVKPANILFDNEGHAKLGDLGLAQVPGGPSRRSQLSTPDPHPGTPGYMSPEQENSGAYLTPASDIYSLGLTLFEMLTGRMYRSQRPGTRAANLRADLPAQVDDLLARMLAEAYKVRPWDGAETAGLLRQALGDLSGALEREKAAKLAQQQAELLEQERQQAAAREEALARQRREQEQAKRQAELLEQEQKAAAKARREALDREETLAKARREEQARREQEKIAPPAEKSFLSSFWPGLLVVGLLMVWAIGTLMNPVPPATPTAAPEAPTRTSVPAATAVPATAVPLKTSVPPATAVPAPTAVPTLGIGSTQTRAQDGMLMVYVPEGPFTMGSKDFSNAAPHQVTLDAFWIDQTDVTNAKYANCVQKSSCTAPVGGVNSNTQSPYYGNSQFDNYPVINVNWDQAKAYCRWVGGDLPTEAQWEKAALGTTGYKYPWGDTLDQTYANYNSKDTTAVCSYPKGNSPYGACDMAGNVWQWVADWFGDYGTSPVTNSSGQVRVLRGGSWGSDEYFVRSAGRSGDLPSMAFNYLGFRCASSK